MRIPCPSGLVFEARSWRIGDQKELLKAKNDGPGTLPKRMVALAAEGVIDPGPYKVEVGGRINWDDVSHSDIAVANVMIRAGKDSKYIFQPNCAGCGKLQKDHMDVDLLDMPVYPASAEGLQHLSTGEPVAKQIGQIQLLFKAIRGRDINTLVRLQEEDEEAMLEVLTCLHIQQIRAPKSSEPLETLPDIRRFWNEQDWDFREEVEAISDTLFGGIDMTFRFTCDHMSCRVEQEQAIPLDLNFYGLDLHARQRRRAKGSSAKSVRELMHQVSSPSSPKPPAKRAST